MIRTALVSVTLIAVLVTLPSHAAEEGKKHGKPASVRNAIVSSEL